MNFSIDDINLFQQPDYIDYNIHQLVENELMTGDKMTCIVNCAESLTAGIYTLFPEIGLFISYGF